MVEEALSFFEFQLYQDSYRTEYIDMDNQSTTVHLLSDAKRFKASIIFLMPCSNSFPFHDAFVDRTDSTRSLAERERERMPTLSFPVVCLQ